jgi:hypothetical protein
MQGTELIKTEKTAKNCTGAAHKYAKNLSTIKNKKLSCLQNVKNAYAYKNARNLAAIKNAEYSDLLNGKKLSVLQNCKIN